MSKKTLDKINNLIYLTAGVCLFLFFVISSRLFLMELIAGIKLQSQKLVNRMIVVQLPPKIATDSAKITSPSASPTPVYTGFCLHVPVLMYHHVMPLNEAKEKGNGSLTVDNKTFESQMSYLNSSGYTSITALKLAEALINKQALPGKSVVVTIDDGYDDIKTYAYPIAQKYRITLNLMISTGLINNPNYLTWDQIKEMLGSGLVEIYNHTWSHYNLSGASKEKITEEIMLAQKQIKEYSGKTVNIFSYPYGSENNSVYEVLRTNNFVAGFSTIPGSIQCDSFILGLHRTRVGNGSLSSYGL